MKFGVGYLNWSSVENFKINIFLFFAAMNAPSNLIQIKERNLPCQYGTHKLCLKKNAANQQLNASSEPQIK